MSMMTKLVLKELDERKDRFAKRQQEKKDDHNDLRRAAYLMDFLFLVLIAVFVAAHWPGPCDGYRYDYEICGPR